MSCFTSVICDPTWFGAMASFLSSAGVLIVGVFCEDPIVSSVISSFCWFVLGCRWELVLRADPLVVWIGIAWPFSFVCARFPLILLDGCGGGSVLG
jgi:hypothetical protein